MGALFAWLEGTGVAMTVASSTGLTASLSAVHLLGFTLVTGGAVVANLGALGVLFPRHQVVDVVRPANRAILIGLGVSLVTGLLLFSARATVVSSNGTFQLKIMLLIVAALLHFVVQPRVVGAHAKAQGVARAAGAISLCLWLGLAITACAFILLE